MEKGKWINAWRILRNAFSKLIIALFCVLIFRGLTASDAPQPPQQVRDATRDVVSTAEGVDTGSARADASPKAVGGGFPAVSAKEQSLSVRAKSSVAIACRETGDLWEIHSAIVLHRMQDKIKTMMWDEHDNPNGPCVLLRRDTSYALLRRDEVLGLGVVKIASVGSDDSGWWAFADTVEPSKPSQQAR